MSEFFKALEQAERDRLRKDQAGAAPAPAQTIPGENGTRAPEAAPVKPAARPAPAKLEASAPAGSEAPPPARPETREPARSEVPKPARPDSSRRAKFEPPAPPRSRVIEQIGRPHESPAPASRFFRPSLRTTDRGWLRGPSGRRPTLLIAQTDPDSAEAEAYRTVRTNIELMPHDGASRHIAITSVMGGDGKSTSAANLAVVAAQGGRRVCLVDADLRRPTLHDVFGLPNVDGFAFALAQGKPLHTVAHPTDIENLSVVVAGRGAHESFQDILTPQRLEKVIAGSEAAFDLVLFDTPPVTSVADSLNVAAACDGVILVVRAGSVPVSVLRRVVGQIAHVKGRVLGVLLNQVQFRATDTDLYRYYRAYHKGRSES